LKDQHGSNPWENPFQVSDKQSKATFRASASIRISSWATFAEILARVKRPLKEGAHELQAWFVFKNNGM
jgi:hypothetical protein